MTRAVQQLLKEGNAAFRSSGRALYSMAHSNLKKSIRKPKADYRRRINNHLDSNNKGRCGRQSSTTPTTGSALELLKVTPYWQRT